MRSISHSAAERLARCCIRRRFISRVNSWQNSSKAPDQELLLERLEDPRLDLSPNIRLRRVQARR
jgi:hypothetical protein